MADEDWGAIGTGAASGAMAGAAAGSVIPGLGTAAGAAVGGVIGGAASYFGGSAAGAAKKAAQAQQEAAERWKQFVAMQEQKALGLVLTPSAMAAHDTALHAQEANVKRQETLAQTINPNLIEAGKQTAQLLQGHAAPVLNQLQQQRQQQRTQMLDQLRTQMGPGAETSSAGQQAMQQFDLQTAGIMNGAQQEYLDKVSNMSIGGGQSLSQSLNAVNGTLSDINAQSPESRAAGLIAQFTGAQSGAQSAIVNSAGGQYIGQALRGQQMQTLGNNLIQGAAAIYGAKNGQNKTDGTAPKVPAAGGAMNPEFTTVPNDFGGTLAKSVNPPAGMPAQKTAYGVPEYLAPNAPGGNQPYDALGSYRNNIVGTANSSLFSNTAGGYGP